MCSTYGGSTPGYTVYTVGAGTAYPNSSSLGSSLSTVKLLVVGDFTIDNNFALVNSLVKVNPGFKISVDVNWINSYSLYLSNTKVFACSGLWKGIELKSFTGITVTNNSQIEDAENAIKAINTAFVGLSIDNSTFNRNRIDLNLEDSGSGGWFVVPPMLSYFVNNKFTCTSPLNGTSDDYTDIGVRMKYISYPFAYNYGNTNNEFRDLDNGMVMDGIGYTVADINYYTFTSIKNKCIEFLNGDYLNVQSTRFEDTKRTGLFFSNSRQLIVEKCYFEEIAHTPQIATPELWGLLVAKPKANNSIKISNQNIFSAHSGTGIILITDAENDYMNAEISNNTLKFLGTSALDILFGITLGGNHSSQSSVNIFNNTFNLDHGVTPNCLDIGITSNGQKNNLKINNNVFIGGGSGKSNYCSLSGSSGINNEFSQNRFMPADIYTNIVARSGLALNSFQNSKICGNEDFTATAVSYIFNDINSSTNFTSNTTYNFFLVGEPLGIRISGGSGITPTIGTQDHRGNVWINGGGVVAKIMRNEAMDAPAIELSQFRVHTTQPSAYFPINIQIPFAPNSQFFKTTTGTPANCLPQSPNFVASGGIDPLVDPLIAQAKFSEYTSNTAQIYDADLHLMRKIKWYPSEYNGNQMYKSFMQKHQGKNKEKIRSLEDAVDENSKIKDIIKDKILALRDKIKILDDNNKKYNKDNRPTKDDRQTYYKQRLELDEGISALYNEHKADKKIKDKEAKSIDDNIVPTTLQERLTKEVYQIYLDAQLNTDGKFTDVQRVRMKQIAATCFTEGGMIVYTARGYLAYEDLKEIQKNIDICDPIQATSAITDNPIQTQISTESRAKPIIFPNPAKEIFTINLNKNINGTASIIDLTGKIMNTYKLNAGENTIQHKLLNGIYIVNIKMSDGQSISQKLLINY